MNNFNYIIDKHEPCDRHKLLLEGILCSSSSSSSKSDRAQIDDDGDEKPKAASSPLASLNTRAIPLPHGMDGCIVLDALSGEECDAIVALCEKEIGFTFWSNPLSGDEERKQRDEQRRQQEQQQQSALPGAEEENVGNDDDDAALKQPGGKFRTCSTIEVNLPAMSSALWARVARFVAPTVSISRDDEKTFQRDLEGVWEADRFCYNVLVARYRAGHHFAPHVDGQSIIHFNRRSMYTALFYLNDCEGGGETIFHGCGDQCQALEVDPVTGKVTGKKTTQVFAWKPMRGSCSIFRYDVLHEGAPVAAGAVKYIIRGDVEFERRPAVCDDENGRRAFALYEQARKLEGEGDGEGAVKLFMAARKLSRELAEILQIV